MRKRIWFGLAVGALSLLIFRLFVFPRSSIIVPRDVDTKALSLEADYAYGNGGLKCLVISQGGRAAYVDASNRIVLKEIPTPSTAAKYVLGAVAESGDAYILDDENKLFRFRIADGLRGLGSIPSSSRALSWDLDDKAGKLWCAATHWTASDPNLVISVIDTQTGHEAGHLDLGITAGNAFLKCQTERKRALVWSAGGSHVYVLHEEGRRLKTDDLLMPSPLETVAFEGDDVVAGLESGVVTRVNPDTRARMNFVANEGDSMRDLSFVNGRIVLARGGGNALFGHGSLDVLDEKSGSMLFRCDAPEGMVTVLGLPTESDILYTAERGPLRRYSILSGCSTLAASKDEAAQSVLYIGRQRDRYLVVRRDSAEVFGLGP